MSARDALPEQLAEISALLPQLKQARADLAAARLTFDALHLRAGQATVEISFAGRRIELTYLGRETGYMPRKVAGRQALLDAIIREQHNFVIDCAGRVEGLEFQLQQLVKAVGGAA